MLWQTMGALGVALQSQRGRQGILWQQQFWTRRYAGYEVGVTAETVSKLCQQGELSGAVELLEVLVQTHSAMSKSLVFSVIKLCTLKKDLVLGRRVHALTVKRGYESDTFLCNHILRMYACHASLQEAMDVFTMVPEPDAFMWSSIISAHVKHGQAKGAIELYHQMRRSSVKPDGHVFVAALQACASEADLRSGQQVHADVLASGLRPDLFVCSCLVDMYAKCGLGQEALRLHSGMQEEGIAPPDAVTFVCLLQACVSVGVSALANGKQLHAQIEEQGLQVDVVVGCSLVNMYAKCGSVHDAKRVFDGLRAKDVVTWNAMIAGYSQQGMGEEALLVYSAMQQEGIGAPDSITFVCLLQACASVGALALETGKQLHAQIEEQGLQVDVAVGNNLVNMYAKCASLEDAQSVFDGLSDKDVVTWTILIAGYSEQGMGQEALHLFTVMQQEGIAEPNAVTFVCLLQACASVGITALERGKKLHACIEEQGLQSNVTVANNLINMYAKCGSLEDARTVFDTLCHKDVVTWNSMIAGYSQKGMGQEALHLYSAMQQEAVVVPDSVTLMCLLQACATVGVGAMDVGKQLHAQVEVQGLQANVSVANSLIDMYAKCGSIRHAQILFDRVPEKNVVTWTTLIAGYCQEGMVQEALQLYKGMREDGSVPPNCVTFVCLLQACANVASLHAGRQVHTEIVEQGLQTDMFVAISLINMYARCGSMVDAQQVFNALPWKPDIVPWNALIAGYSRQGNSEVVFDLVDRMREDGIQPDSITFISILRVCTHTGLVMKGQEQFEAMSREYGITPTAEHYSCMVDLLGRAGQVQEALALARTMPVQSQDAVVWHSLLGACQKWSNLEVGRHAFNAAVKLDEQDAAAYVLMANIYTGNQMWEQAQEMQARRRGVGAWKQPGQSWWTDMDGLVHTFAVWDILNHPESEGICARLKQLACSSNGERRVLHDPGWPPP